MADTKTSAEQAADELTGAELVRIVQSSNNRRTTTQDIADLASAATTVEINTQTDSYTLVLGDAGKVVEMNKATANNLTVPPNSSVAFATGTVINVRQLGAGQTTIVAGSGVTINSPETLKIRIQYGQVTLHKRGTNEWCLEGNLEPTP